MRDMPFVDRSSVAQARSAAVGECVVPLPCASRQVIVDPNETDEYEDRKGAAVAHPDRYSHGGRSRLQRRARLASLLVLVEAMVQLTDS